jgi:hypothetical protein
MVVTVLLGPVSCVFGSISSLSSLVETTTITHFLIFIFLARTLVSFLLSALPTTNDESCEKNWREIKEQTEHNTNGQKWTRPPYLTYQVPTKPFNSWKDLT